MPTRTKANDPDFDNGVYYPSSDGQPMSETQFQYIALTLLVDALQDYYATRPDVYAVGNIFWYWEEGDPQVCRSPDAMVIFGVDKTLRRSFRSWREGGAIPRACFEIVSKRTWRANLGEVREDYEAAGVPEYFVFDPTREFLPAALLGFRLRNGVYQPISPAADESITSRELGLKLLPEGLMLRLIDAKTGERVLTKDERAEAERQRVYMERERAEAAEERAEVAEERADAADERADAEHERAEALAAEVARLQALLRQQNSDNGAS